MFSTKQAAYPPSTVSLTVHKVLQVVTPSDLNGKVIGARFAGTEAIVLREVSRRHEWAS